MERGNIKVSDKLDVKGWSVESLYILMWKNQIDYYGAAEPPVRCGVSHLSGLTEPRH